MLMLSRRLLMPLSVAVAVAAATTVPAATAVPVAGPVAWSAVVADIDPVTFAAEPAASAASVASEADVVHRGHVAFWSDQLEIRLRTANRGPADVSASTVRLRFSEPLAVRQQLPAGCLWGGRAAVLCETGALAKDGPARRTALDLRLAGRPAEVVVRVDTVWSGGARDADSGNDTHTVLAPSTGDPYAF
ncbi:hypothetical protein PV376_34165 [Streptomyces sp. NRRL_ISP-5395]|uniref:hypothetical protein n=1 Tax=Streptomyces TaxID=1883 RepID=UPI0019970FC0|nr:MULTISPECIES: hypothetical protein [Streptomyces]MCL6290253.1 hypothetical protein [Streptomyces sp. 43Y-GA-1]MDX2674560.1 hypothetical protein [Streptomyces sp. NRRL_ISP-5395]GHF87927.1 hypothetical protein GCM10010504_65640 [Streptomyces griseus]